MTNVPDCLPDLPAADENDGDVMDLLTDALAGYLEEVDGYRVICQRHESTTAAYPTPTALHLARLFPWQEETVAYIREALERLDGWRQSPFWKSEGRAWVALEAEIIRRTPKDEGGYSLITRGVSWQGRPILVCVASLPGSDFFQVELLLPIMRGGMPELPLRQAAHGLLCHEKLVPKQVARPLPCSTMHRGHTLREFLKRAMPQNLYASKCFPLGSAEK